MAKNQGTQEAAVAANHGSTVAVARPEPFKTRSGDARRFLQYFTLWARAQGPPLNDKPGGTPYEPQWIASFLSFLQGEAAVWAVPYLQGIEAYHSDTAVPKATEFPCNGSWASFVQEFKDRFQAADDAAIARRDLSKLVQGNATVPQFAARFLEIANRSGYSDVDLMYRFKQGLNDKARHYLTLALLVKKADNLKDLIKLASDSEFLMREETANRRITPVTAGPDPMAMDIDATRAQAGPSGKSRLDFLQAMKGKCFGCGSTGHTKKDGNHGSIKCTYCSRFGHYERVCQDRYMGLE